MPRAQKLDFDPTAEPFDRFTGIHRLSAHRSGRDAADHARHQLYAGHDREGAGQVLIKVTSKPGLIYEQNLSNEITSLTTINRGLPASPYFPRLVEHGRLRDGRLFVIMSLFEELPLATTIGPERLPGKLVGHIRTTLAVCRALIDLHALRIFHIDLNPMNILYRAEKGHPIIRIVDFESSYQQARHTTGVFYDPPTTPGFSAPEVTRLPPDARADLYSLGAVFYTLLAGYGWTWEGDISTGVAADRELDQELSGIVAKAVHPDPNQRYSSIQPFRDALAAYLERIWPGRSW